MSYRSNFLPYVAAALLIQPLAACSSEQSSTNAAVAAAAEPVKDAVAAQPAVDSKLVLAFGDSLYAGYGVPAADSFPAELQKSLTARGLAVTVDNAGVSGDTTSAGLRRLAFVLDGMARKPDLVLVNLGGNDMLRGVDPAETRANLTAICEELKRRGLPIMLTGMVAAPNLGDEYADAFNPIYLDLAKRFDAVLYPFFLDGVIGVPGLMLPDRVHPSPAGIDRIVARVAPIVADKLGDKPA